MALISTKLHAVGDYAGGALMLATASMPFVRDRRAATLLRSAGATTLVASALTDYELGLWRKIPMPAHLGLDGATGALMGLSAVWLRGAGLGNWLPFALLAPGEIAGAALTARRPGDRTSAGQAVAGAVGSMAGTGTGAPAAAEGVGPAPDPLSGAASGVTGEGLAAQDPGAGGGPVAPAPLETPGPSVTPPALPESDTERAERVDASLPANEAGDDLVAEQEAAAAAEAAAIGGPTGTQTGDPAMDPVYEAGGGEQEGFEAAEDDLIENATHGEGHGDPERDAIAPEVQADRSTAVYGETNTLPSTEVTDDPSTPGDDPGEGPGLAADRGPGPAPQQP
jgi:hypothetical protein